MKIIDLSQSLYHHMPVYPGDPPVKIEQIHTLKKEGWRLRCLQLSSHTGTHVDAFCHMDKKGKTLDEMPVNKFMGPAKLVKVSDQFPREIGLAFMGQKLPVELWQRIKIVKAPFILVDKDCDFPVELERKLLQEQVITFTDLVNFDKLPNNKKFMFYGLPLKIKDGDGSPVRAVAVL